MSSDIIAIHGLEIWCHIGVPDEERNRPQRLLLTLRMETDCALPAQRDDIAAAVDYARVAETAKRIASERPRKLIETLAEDIARSVLQNFSPQRVTIELEKFPLKDARSVSVTITRPPHA